MKRTDRSRVVGVVVVGVIMSADCATDVPEPTIELDAATATFTLVEEQRFGWRQLADSTRPLSDIERTFQGAVLSQVADMEEGPDGLLYVLDRDYFKVVVFGPDGSFRRLIPGGAGEGPGEFTRPWDLTVAPDGRLFVLDDGTGRISVFAADGEFSHTIDVAGLDLRGIQWTRGHLVALRNYRHGNHAILVIDPDGRVTDSTLVLPDSVVGLADYGEMGKLGFAQDGGALFAFPSPGTWTRVPGDGRTLEGASLYSGVRGMMVPIAGTRARMVPIATTGIGELPDGSVVLYYRYVDPELARRGELDLEIRIALHNPAGRLRDDIPFPDTTATLKFTTSRRSNAIYVESHGPDPVVVRYRVASPEG